MSDLNTPDETAVADNLADDLPDSFKSDRSHVVL